MFTRVASPLTKLGGLLIVILISTHSPIAFEASSARVSSTRTQDKYRSEFDFISQTISDCYSYLTIKQQRYAFSFGDLTRQFRERLSSCKSDEEYVKIVREYLKSFHDGHLRLVLTDSAKNSPPKEPAISNNWDSENRNILVVRVRRLWDKDEVKKSFAETLSLAAMTHSRLISFAN